MLGGKGSDKNFQGIGNIPQILHRGFGKRNVLDTQISQPGCKELVDSAYQAGIIEAPRRPPAEHCRQAELAGNALAVSVQELNNIFCPIKIIF